MNFATIYHKNSKNDTCLLFDGFDLKIIILKKLVFLSKKNHFHIWKKYSKGALLFQNFLTLFDFKSFGGVLWPLSFFSWIQINFAFQKLLVEFFLVKPLPLQQPPNTKLLISVCLGTIHKGRLLKRAGRWVHQKEIY